MQNFIITLTPVNIQALIIESSLLKYKAIITSSVWIAIDKTNIIFYIVLH